MATESSEVKLTIGNENVKANDVTGGMEIDIHERDPNNLHDDLKVVLIVCPFNEDGT